MTQLTKKIRVTTVTYSSGSAYMVHLPDTSRVTMFTSETTARHLADDMADYLKVEVENPDKEKTE